MQYLLLIHVIDPAIHADPRGAESRAAVDGYWKLDADANAAGVPIDSNALDGHDRSSTLQVRNGEQIVSDARQRGDQGSARRYSQVDVPGIEEASFWAAQLPDARRGTIEIRPIVDVEPPA